MYLYAKNHMSTPTALFRLHSMDVNDIRSCFNLQEMYSDVLYVWDTMQKIAEY
jgi:hypothetical protein